MSVGGTSVGRSARPSYGMHHAKCAAGENVFLSGICVWILSYHFAEELHTFTAVISGCRDMIMRMVLLGRDELTPGDPNVL